MKRTHHGYLLALPAIALLAAGCVATRARGLAEGGPRAAFEVTRRDVGSIKAGDSTVVRFPFKNAGESPLQILYVDGGCGCLKPEFPRSVPAGGTGEIRTTFEPLAMWDGKVEKTLKVHTNDPTTPQYSLTVSANIIPYVKMEPASPLIVKYRRRQVIQREVRLTPRPDSGLRLSDARCDSPSVQVKLDPPAAGDPAGAYRLHLTLGPEHPTGDYTTTVRFNTTEKRLREGWLVVVAQAEDGPVVTPNQVVLPSIRLSAVPKELCRVQVFSRVGKMKLLAVETGHPGLRTEIVAKHPNQFYEVILKAAGPWQPGPMNTTIRFKTDDPDYPTVEIPFNATVER